MSKKKTKGRHDLGARWSDEERSDIDFIASLKGVKPTQVIRMGMKEHIEKEKLERRARGLPWRPN